MTTTAIKPYTMQCDRCGFSTHDQPLMDGHSCQVQAYGGRCEDYPACGHEFGDCNGELYGSDEAIAEDARRHAWCAHEAGYCDLDRQDEEEHDAHGWCECPDIEHECGCDCPQEGE